MMTCCDDTLSRVGSTQQTAHQAWLLSPYMLPSYTAIVFVVDRFKVALIDLPITLTESAGFLHLRTCKSVKINGEDKSKLYDFR
jgi:hypothetical protein